MNERRTGARRALEERGRKGGGKGRRTYSWSTAREADERRKGARCALRESGAMSHREGGSRGLGA